MRYLIPKVHGETRREKLFRSIALMLVLAAVIWAFTMNNQRVVETLNRESAIYDETGRLNNEQKKFITSFTRSLKDEFGLSCRIQIFGGEFAVPELDSKTMYIGLSPSTDTVEMRFPVLMRQALGDDFIESLKTEHFLPSFKYDDWQEEIQVVLIAIYDKLMQLQKGATPSE